MIDKLFLIDCMALIYRAYYAMIKNPLTSSNGKNTSVLYGFTNTLLKILKDEKPKYISVILDTKAKTFRHKHMIYIRQIESLCQMIYLNNFQYYIMF